MPSLLPWHFLTTAQQQVHEACCPPTAASPVLAVWEMASGGTELYKGMNSLQVRRCAAGASVALGAGWGRKARHGQRATRPAATQAGGMAGAAAELLPP